MAREYELKPAPSDETGMLGSASTSINRRQFLRYGFNTAAGVLTASLGMLGFAAILLPPGGGGAVIWPFSSGQRAVKTRLGTVRSTFSP